MKFILILLLIADGGFAPHGQMFDSAAECSAALAKVREAAAHQPDIAYAAACLRVRNSSEKEV